MNKDIKLEVERTLLNSVSNKAYLVLTYEILVLIYKSLINGVGDCVNELILDSIKLRKIK